MMINSLICSKCKVFSIDFTGQLETCMRCETSSDLVRFPAVMYSPLSRQYFQSGIIANNNTFENCKTAYHVSGGRLLSKGDTFKGCGRIVKSENKAKVKLISPTIED